MSVYVDNARIRYRGMVMCHMLADSHAELEAAAEVIGISRRWIQHSGTYREHYDISGSKRTLAVRMGAVRIDARGVARLLKARREERKIGGFILRRDIRGSRRYVVLKEK